jgi:transposase
MHAEASVANEAGGDSAVVRKGKRRRWSEAERRQIVEETLAAGVSVALVARSHGVNANQVFSWRKLYRRGLLGSTGLLPVKITESASATTLEMAAAAEHRSGSGVIHITVGKAQIRIEGDVDRDTLRVVLKGVLR